MKKLDFMIVGAQKAGTTALATFLGCHPEIAMSKQKECHIFDELETDGFSIDDINSRYAPHFEGASSDQLWGEATPIYLYFPWIAKYLYRYNPELKIIVILREPAERALSQFRMERDRGAEKLPFSLALLAEPFRLFSARVLEQNSSHRSHSYRDRGMYSRQILNLYRYFSSSQVVVISQSDLLRRHEDTLRAVFHFLDVADGVSIEAENIFSGGPPPESEGMTSRLLRLSYLMEYRRLRRSFPKIVASWLKRS